MLTYEIKVAGLRRTLKLSSIAPDLMIAGFVVFGDVELTAACAAALLERLPECDFLIAPEAKAIPLIHEMARQSGRNDYMLARKAAKAYMDGVFSTRYISITTQGVQELYMDGSDARRMAGKRVVIVDDVISTGESLKAMEQLVAEAGGILVGKVAILAEGDAADRDDIIFLERLPLFNGKGEPLS